MSRAESTRAPASLRNALTRLRKLWRLLRTVDLDNWGELIAHFDHRQRRLEQSQQHIEAIVREAHTKIDELLLLRTEIDEVLRLRSQIDQVLLLNDSELRAASSADIKNLWYELGRSLAEKNLSARPRRVDHTRLPSKLCNQADFESDWFLYWCGEMLIAPNYHRKFWELCYVAQALFSEGQLTPGRRGIGFGCGEEPLPSLFAKYGVKVLATDLDSTRPETKLWRQTNEYAGAVEAIRRSDICPDQALLANIEFEPVDMNALPHELDGQFDFCWSACALEHLGSLENGLNFIENSLRMLKPGGIAVHTTEFTLSNGETIDHQPTVLYQRHHLEELAIRLHAAEFDVAEFDFNPGSGVLDRFIDLPPFRGDDLIGLQHYAHLKLLFEGYRCTSVGIIIKTRA